MPRSTLSRARRTLTALIVLLVVASGGLVAAVQLSDARYAPLLGLDLAGGTQIVLTPKLTSGSGEITEDEIQQSIAIIRQRVDSSGVSEAQISASGNNINVDLPGDPAQQRQAAALVTQSAQLRFRPVLVQAPADLAPAPAAPEGGDPAAPQEEGAPGQDDAQPTPPDGASVAPPPEGDGGEGGEPAPEPSDATSNSLVPGALLADPAAPAAPSEEVPPAGEEAPAAPVPPDAAIPEGLSPPANAAAGTPSDLEQITPEIAGAFEGLDCSDPTDVGTSLDDDPDAPIVTCDTEGQSKFILGPVELEGTNLKTASAGLGQTQTGAATNEWQVTLDLDNEGAKTFLDITSRISNLPPPNNQFAIVLDGSVVSAPQVTQPIAGGSASISGGGITQASAKTLADQLKFGALPISFEKQTESQISPALGAEQLQRGLIAGLIGLGLVALYSLLQYRALGLVTIGSLLIAGLSTYLAIALLGWAQGYRLSLAGVAGLIVAIGITADSFIVFFERIRDEVREGRPLIPAVETAWKRARRTIIISDVINFLAAVVLYVLAVGNVRGFAFTLGLTTLIDLVVVVMFTHPVIVLISRWKFFSQGHKLSGFDAEHLGRTVAYAGRGRVRGPGSKNRPPELTGGSRRGAPREPEGRQTIAERKAAALADEQQQSGGGTATVTRERDDDHLDETTGGLR